MRWLSAIAGIGHWRSLPNLCSKKQISEYYVQGLFDCSSMNITSLISPLPKGKYNMHTHAWVALEVAALYRHMIPSLAFFYSYLEQYTASGIIKSWFRLRSNFRILTLFSLDFISWIGSSYFRQNHSKIVFGHHSSLASRPLGPDQVYLGIKSKLILRDKLFIRNQS